MRLVAALLLASSLVSVPASAVTDFGVAGPETVETRTFVTVEVNGTRLTSEVWFPSAPGLRPGIALSHGFASDRFTVAAVGRHLASWGFVVVAPNLPSTFSPDPVRNAALARAIVDTWLPARSADASSYLANRVYADRSGVIGHSAGGLSSVLALKDAPAGSRAAGVLLDWVDSVSAQGTAALPSVSAPAAFLFAEPGSCNASGNGVTPSALSTGPRLQLKVVGATHCDPGDPIAIGCTSVCGGFDASRAALFLGYGTAWFRRFLLDDPEAEAWLGGETYQSHLANNRITAATVEDVPSLEEPDAGSPPVVDAGTVEPVDAGAVDPVDAGPDVTMDAGEEVVPDASVDSVVDAGDEGNTADSGTVEAADAGDVDVASGGCECGSFTASAWLLLVPLFRRRRR